MQPYDRKLKQFSRALRSNMTDAELCIWKRLRNKQLYGVQFYRQKPLLSFIVDFYCPKAKLVIELDGAQHLEPGHQTRDKKRDESLLGMGLKVLRFDDMQVLRETDAVLEVIYAEVVRRLEENSNPPQPPFSKVGNCIAPF